MTNRAKGNFVVTSGSGDCSDSVLPFGAAQVVIKADEDRAEVPKLMRPDLGHDVLEIFLAEVGRELLHSVDEKIALSALTH